MRAELAGRRVQDQSRYLALQLLGHPARDGAAEGGLRLGAELGLHGDEVVGTKADHEHRDAIGLLEAWHDLGDHVQHRDLRGDIADFDADREPDLADVGREQHDLPHGRRDLGNHDLDRTEAWCLERHRQRLRGERLGEQRVRALERNGDANVVPTVGCQDAVREGIARTRDLLAVRAATGGEETEGEHGAEHHE